MYESKRTPPEPRCQPVKYPRPFLVQPANLLIDNCCPKTKSLLARVIGGEGHYLIGLTCKTWACRYCAATKIRRLSWLTQRASPNRLLTLTVDPKLYANPRQAFDRTRPFVPELIRALRARFGDVDYLRVTEETKSGWPHYHLLVRSGFLPHAVVKKLWNKYTGAKIVDLRQVDNKFGAYQYLTKYLTKMHSLDWTERHVSYSKKFFPEPPTPTHQGPELGDYQRLDEHPYSWLGRFCMSMTVTQEADYRWRLDTKTSSPPQPDSEPF